MHLTWILMFVLFILTMTCMILLKKTPLSREKNSPYECGFNPLESARLPFSIHFFLLGILFVILDIEIVLLTPLMMVMNCLQTTLLLMTTLTLLAILIWGLLHEWNYQSLNWTH